MILGSARALEMAFSGVPKGSVPGNVSGGVIGGVRFQPGIAVQKSTARTLPG
jgi:hypothetical protein